MGSVKHSSDSLQSKTHLGIFKTFARQHWDDCWVFVDLDDSLTGWLFIYHETTLVNLCAQYDKSPNVLTFVVL